MEINDMFDDEEDMSRFSKPVKAEMNKELIERLALEVEARFSAPYISNESIVHFATRFLSAVDAERGKEAVAWNYELERTAFDRLIAQGIDKDTPLFLAPQPAIPEGMALVSTEIIDRFPEINPSNYAHDDACALNAWGVELVLSIAAAGEKL